MWEWACDVVPILGEMVVGFAAACEHKNWCVDCGADLCLHGGLKIFRGL